MTDETLSQVNLGSPAVEPYQDDDLFYMVQDIGSGPDTVAGKMSGLKNYVGGHPPIVPNDFYQSTDSNFGPAVQRALDYANSIAVNDDTGVYRGTRDMQFTEGDFNLGSTCLDMFVTMNVRGMGTGAEGGVGTRLRFSGTTGVRVQRLNTTGASGLRANGHSGDGCVFDGLMLQGDFNSATGTENEYHGFHLKARAQIRNCWVKNFQGDGIHHVALLGSSGATEGNANCSYFERNTLQYNRNGYFADGDNTNACYNLGMNCSYNRQWGLWDSSFLGNTHIGFHLDANAQGLGDSTLSKSAATYGGNVYFCLVGQESWCSTNAPTGTTASNQGWIYHAPGGAGTYGARAWVSGMTWRAGGPLCTDNANAPHFVSGYCEGGQFSSMLARPTVMFGGDFANAAKEYGTNNEFRAIIFAGGGLRGGSVAGFATSGLQVTGDFAVAKRLICDGGFMVGSGSWLGSINGLQMFVDSTWGASIYGVNGSSGSLLVGDGSGNNLFYNPLGTRDIEFFAGDLKVPTGKGIKVAGNRVITDRQAAIADDASGAANQAKVNAILAALRAHGLIAP